MGDPEPRHLRRCQDDLAGLLEEVRRTRTAQQGVQKLMGAASASGLLPARRATLSALEAYADALDRHGWPVPSKMRLDIQLLRSLCGRDVSH